MIFVPFIDSFATRRPINRKKKSGNRTIILKKSSRGCCSNKVRQFVNKEKLNPHFCLKQDHMNALSESHDLS